MCAGDHSPTHLDTFAEHEVGAEEQKQNYEETNAHENLDSVPVVSMEVDQSDEDHRKESVAYQNLVRERLRYIWEDMAPLANASGLDLSDARLIGLRTSIQELVQRLSYTEMQETLGVLMTLISNAMVRHSLTAKALFVMRLFAAIWARLEVYNDKENQQENFTVGDTQCKPNLSQYFWRQNCCEPACCAYVPPERWIFGSCRKR
jgi:hypothetical protein